MEVTSTFARMLPRRLSVRLNRQLNHFPAVALLGHGRSARQRFDDTPEPAPEWMRGFGELKRLHKETLRVQSIIDEEFEVIEPADQY